MAEKSEDISTREKLPYDLVAEILSSLPAHDLWPLRCVCKLWFQLIASNPQFAKSVLDRSVQSKSNPSVILALREKKEEDRKKIDLYLATDHTECDTAIKLKLPFLGDEQDAACFLVYGICNGMLCLSAKDKREFYIWNPLTNDHITISYPVTPICYSKRRQSTVFGFGFVESVNEYTIIKLVRECKLGKLEWRTELSVYTLGKDSSWRTIMEDLPFYFDFKGIPCPQINGQVMWIGKTDGELPVLRLLVFDLKNESLYEIQRPPIQDRSGLTSIVDFGGLLCVFNTNHSGVDMWMIKLDGENCSLDKSITLGRPEVVGDFSLLVPLGVVALSGDILVLKTQREMITYNLSTKSINPLKEFCCPIVNAFAFAGSIISPRAINGAGRTLEER